MFRVVITFLTKKSLKQLRIEESSLYPTEDALKEAVKSGKETKGYAIYDYDHYKTYFRDKGFVSGMDQALNSVLKDHLIAQKLVRRVSVITIINP